MRIEEFTDRDHAFDYMVYMKGVYFEYKNLFYVVVMDEDSELPIPGV
jgi:hypothetical protein